MHHIRRALLVVSMGPLLVIGACGVVPATSTSASTSTSAAVTAQLSGASEVPAVVTGASGMLEGNFSASSNLLTWKITYSGLSGPATGAHFHGPAMAGQNAGVVLPMSPPLDSPMTGSATLTPSQAADLVAGKWYVNLHTAANPNGEVRGQVRVGP